MKPLPHRPRLILAESAAEAATIAAGKIVEQLVGSPETVLGLATGRSQIPVYAGLVAAFRNGAVSFAKAASFNLDEYIGLPIAHPASFHGFMTEHLFRHVDMAGDRMHLPDGAAHDPERAARCYETAVAAAGGIGLQLLGIGVNGHIGFNEPGSPESSRTRVVALSETTRQVNLRDFPEHRIVPSQAITMGIATILEAREILLVATGRTKRSALRRALSMPPASDSPASWLQLHGNATIICDRAAMPDDFARGR